MKRREGTKKGDPARVFASAVMCWFCASITSDTAEAGRDRACPYTP